MTWPARRRLIIDYRTPCDLKVVASPKQLCGILTSVHAARIYQAKELELLLGFRTDAQLRSRVRYDRRRCALM